MAFIEPINELIKQDSPYTSCYTPRVVYPNELVAGGGNVEVRLLLIDEERIWHPDVFDKLRANAERLDAGPGSECESGVSPKLPEVEIQRKVLYLITSRKRDRENSLTLVCDLVIIFPLSLSLYLPQAKEEVNSDVTRESEKEVYRMKRVHSKEGMNSDER